MAVSVVSVLFLAFVAAACRSSLPPKVRAYGAWKLACREELIEATVTRRYGDEWEYRLDCFDWNQDHVWVMCRNDGCRETGPPSNWHPGCGERNCL
jgi:hypothetical protein